MTVKNPGRPTQAWLKSLNIVELLEDVKVFKRENIGGQSLQLEISGDNGFCIVDARGPQAKILLQGILTERFGATVKPFGAYIGAKKAAENYVLQPLELAV